MNVAGGVPLSAGAKLRLAVEIVSSYVLARWTLQRRGLRDALRTLRATTPQAPPATVSGVPAVDCRQLARAVMRTLAILPADSRCLMRSLVLTRVLARRGMQSQLVIAVRPGEAFAAHSWVERDGEPLLPASAPAFERLTTL